MNNKKKLLSAFFAILISLVFYGQSDVSFQTQEHSSNSISQAFADKKSDIQVRDTAVVSKILRDDNKGHRHQRFIVRLKTGQTILIAHNIDLAPKIHSLKSGDEIEFYGEYEYNERGGVVHWTHHDPKNRHIGGWLKHKGKIYE